MHPVLAILVIGGLFWYMGRRSRLRRTSGRCACVRSGHVSPGASRCACSGGSGSSEQMVSRMNCGCSCKMCRTKTHFDHVLTDHVHKTRVVVMNAFSASSGLTASVESLMANQDDLAALLSQSATLQKRASASDIMQSQSALWRQHIQIAYDIVGDVIAKGGRGEQLQADWKANASQISRALSALNPSVWKVSELEAHMSKHLQLLGDFVGAYAREEWEQTILLADRSTYHFRQFAIVLARGTV